MFSLLALLACAPAIVPVAVTPSLAGAPWAGAHEAPADISGLLPAKSASGLTWYVVREGEGLVAQRGLEVEVHYAGFLADGRKFDASYDRGRPFTFKVGAGRVIPGWDEGVAGMREGEQRQLHVPAKLGYGTRGAGGVIPPNANLVFDVELVRVR